MTLGSRCVYESNKSDKLHNVIKRWHLPGYLLLWVPDTLTLVNFYYIM